MKIQIILAFIFILPILSCQKSESKIGYVPVKKSGYISNVPADIETVKVFKSDKSIQCEFKGIELDVMAQELLDKGITIFCWQKESDGLFRTSVCGSGTGSINVYLISEDSLQDAESLGFNSVSELSEYRDSPCE